MFKKILAALSTAILALAMVAVGAASASAHHSTIVANVSCSTDHQYTVVWSVTNSEHLVETITASSNGALVPVGTTFGDQQTKTFTETISVATSKTLTLSAIWSNHVTNTNSGTVKVSDFPDCTPEPQPITLCHAIANDSAASGWTAETLDSSQVVASAHNTDHDADIIPAFDYWAQVAGAWVEQAFTGKNLNTTFSGFVGGDLLTEGCGAEQPVAAPTFLPALCSDSGEVSDGSYTIPSQTGVVYKVRLNGVGSFTAVAAGTYPLPVGGVVEVKAVGDPSWITLTGATSWTYTVLSPGECLILVTPVAPMATPVGECGVDGSITFPSTVGVRYELTIGDGLSGPYTVTATPTAGYRFSGPQIVTFTGDLGAATSADLCGQLPDFAIVYPSYSATPMTCTSAGSYTIGELSPGTITWTVNGAITMPGTYPVTAAQSVTLVAAPTLLADGLDPAWTNPVVLSFTSPQFCDLTTLAITGANRAFGLGLVGVLIVLSGLGFYAAHRRLVAD